MDSMDDRTDRDAAAIRREVREAIGTTNYFTKVVHELEYRTWTVVHSEAPPEEDIIVDDDWIVV